MVVVVTFEEVSDVCVGVGVILGFEFDSADVGNAGKDGSSGVKENSHFWARVITKL